MKTIFPAETQLLLVPQPYTGRKRTRKAEFPPLVTSIQELSQLIFDHTGSIESNEASQRLEYTLIHHTRLTHNVLVYLDKIYLRPFSAMNWSSDIFPLFRLSLDTSIFQDYRSIRPYALKRSRLHMPVFENICLQLDRSRRIVGRMTELENEVTKQHYMNPISAIILSLFSGQLINLPAHLLKGSIGSPGRCEYTISLLDQSMMLFVEFKDSLFGSPERHSNIIAQIIGKIDGGDLYNESCELGGIPIHAILTDDRAFEFYIYDFSRWRISRGVGTAMEGIPFHNEYQICLPASERDPGYLTQLTMIIKVIFNIFIQSYVNTIYSKRAYSERHTIIERDELGESYVPRKSMDF